VTGTARCLFLIASLKISATVEFCYHQIEAGPESGTESNAWLCRKTEIEAEFVIGAKKSKNFLKTDLTK